MGTLMIPYKTKREEGPTVPHNNKGLDKCPKKAAAMQIGSLIFWERGL